MYRRECYDRIGGYNEALRHQEDFDFWIKFIERYPVHQPFAEEERQGIRDEPVGLETHKETPFLCRPCKRPERFLLHRRFSAREDNPGYQVPGLIDHGNNLPDLAFIAPGLDGGIVAV
jgi:hypothetical protein